MASATGDGRQVRIKTVKGLDFLVELSSCKSTANLKEQIVELHSELGPASGMKLIFNGKILEDAQILEDSGITGGSVLVAMGSKPKT